MFVKKSKLMIASIATLSIAALTHTAIAEDKVLAKVNGHTITAADVTSLMSDLGPQARGIPPNQVLMQLIEQKLVVTEAMRLGLDKTNDYKVALKAASERIMGTLLVRQQLEKAISEDSLKKFYDEKYADFKGQEEVHARHILVKTKAEADQILGSLQGGADFISLAKQKSTGPSGANGGDLGYFTAERMVPAFSAAAFALEVGQVSQPVKTQFGWHVIKLEDRRSQQAPDFAQIKRQIHQELSEKALTDFVDGLRAKATIEMAE